MAAAAVAADVGRGGGPRRAPWSSISAGWTPASAASRCEVACDVTNPLLGERGAAATYGPQKGASPAQVGELDARNAAWADALEAATGRAARDVPGAGAAGGVGFAMLCLADRFAAFALRPGVELVMESVGFAERLARADLVITGEGRIDAQTAFGKTALGVARMAQASRRPLHRRRRGRGAGRGGGPRPARRHGRPGLGAAGAGRGGHGRRRRPAHRLRGEDRPRWSWRIEDGDETARIRRALRETTPGDAAAANRSAGSAGRRIPSRPGSGASSAPARTSSGTCWTDWRAGTATRRGCVAWTPRAS